MIYILSERKVPQHCIFSYYLLVITFCKHCSSGYCPQEGHGRWWLHMGTVSRLERENADSPWTISHHYVHEAVTHKNEIDRKRLFFLNLSCSKWQLLILDPFLLCIIDQACSVIRGCWCGKRWHLRESVHAIASGVKIEVTGS